MLEKSYTKLIWVIILSAVISFIPLIIYFWQFFGASLSKDTITWGAFGSLVSGVFSMLSIAILSYTLLITLKNNKDSQLYYESELILSEQKLNSNREASKKEYIIQLVIQHVFALNKKLDEKKYSIPVDYSSEINVVGEEAFLNFIERKYILEIKADKINLTSNHPTNLNDILDCSILLTGYAVSYYDESLTIINILNIISNVEDDEFKNDLVSLFHSLTIARRTFWLLMYVSLNQTDLIEKNIGIIYLPEVIRNNLPLNEINNKWQ
ncbi:hypothetical protein [Providencia sp. PROV075]|uniref:hypothetical protein n=1 Tax=Providencia sp. PROV075 TaxID=2949797 RepID=UPI00234A567C|nr:hypothetical protein [Providencia sp. PROV075]